MPGHHNLEIGRELRRIGVDLSRFQGLATPSPGIGQDALLHWLRTLPTGRGHVAFEATLPSFELLVAAVHEAAGKEACSDPGYRDPEYDELLELMTELDRVIPIASRPKGSGLNFPRGRAHALAVLKRLPDGAGPSKVAQALAEGE